MKPGDRKNQYRLVDKFSQFQLISNSVYPYPPSTAAYLFSTKSTHDTDIKRVQSLAKNVKSWKQANGPKPYVNLPDNANERDEDNQERSEDEKVVTKTFTKKSFKEPMCRLSNAVQNLRTTLINTGESRLFEDVLIEYNGIQKMTGHGRHFECIQEDEDYNDARDSDNEESENTDDNYSHGLHSSSNLSKNSESSSDSELLDNSASNQIEKNI